MLHGMHTRKPVGQVEVFTLITSLADVGDIHPANGLFIFTLTKDHGPVVVDTKKMIIVHRYPYISQCVAIPHDESYILTNDRKELVFHNVSLFHERIMIVPLERSPVKLQISKLDKQSIFMQDDRQTIWSIKVTFSRRTFNLRKICVDPEMQEFKVSNSEAVVLVRCAHCLFVYNVKTSCQLCRIRDLPPVYAESFTSFNNAAFSPDSRYVLATRHIYLGVWDAQTGEAIRLFQPTLCPLTHLLVCARNNLAVTISQDAYIQVSSICPLLFSLYHLAVLSPKFSRLKLNLYDFSTSNK